jgi:hypothetical protein
MRHVYADFIDQRAQAGPLPRRRVPVGPQGLGHRRGHRVPGVPRRLRHRDVAPRAPRSSTACSTAIRASPASARSRRGPTWRPSCGPAACRWCALESQRPLADFDVVGFSLQYELTFTNVLTLLDLGGVGCTPPTARQTRRWCSSAARSRPTPSRWRRSSTPRSSARPRRSCRRWWWRGPRCAARSAPARAPGRRAGRAGRAFPLYVPDALRHRGRRRHRHDRGRRAARSAPRPGCGGRWCATSTRTRSRPTRRCRTPRRCSSAPRSRSRAAAPRAAGSARPA